MTPSPHGDPAASFYHLISAGEERGRHGEAEGLGGLEIDEQLDLRRLLDRQLGRLIAVEDFPGVDADQTVIFSFAASITDQATGPGEEAILGDHGHRVTERQCADLFALSGLMTSASARGCPQAAKTVSKSRSVLACRTSSCIPRTGAAASRPRENCSVRTALVGLTSTATLVAVGINSRTSSSRFGPTSTFKFVTPVRLPPGRFKLATSPTSTGSTATANTIGIAAVAACAASAEAVPPPATITVTDRK